MTTQKLHRKLIKRTEEMKASRVGKVSLTGPQQRREFVPVWFSFMGLKEKLFSAYGGPCQVSTTPNGPPN